MHLGDDEEWSIYGTQEQLGNVEIDFYYFIHHCRLWRANWLTLENLIKQAYRAHFNPIDFYSNLLHTEEQLLVTLACDENVKCKKIKSLRASFSMNEMHSSAVLYGFLFPFDASPTNALSDYIN